MPKRTASSSPSTARTSASQSRGPLVGIVMGSKSDLKTVSPATELLKLLEIPYEVRVVSAHRTPDLTFEYATTAEERGLAVIIAAAGGAAALPGMVAALTVLPVLGIPVASTSLNGMDSLLSIVQMPRGVPVGTLAIGEAGAANAALFAASIIGLGRPDVRERLRAWRENRKQEALSQPPIEQ